MWKEVFPAEREKAGLNGERVYRRDNGEYAYPPVTERLSETAHSRDLWNLFLSVSGLMNQDNAPVVGREPVR